MSRDFLTPTRDAARLLGHRIAIARRQQQRTASEIAQRAGITRQTLRRVEEGDPTVALGIAFDVATVLSMPLFGVDSRQLAELTAQGKRDLALLPDRVDVAVEDVDDEF